MIKVTAAHIRDGRVNSLTGGPLNLAITDWWGDRSTIHRCFVGDGWASTPDCVDHYLPDEVKEWLRKFDRGEQVEPFEFELGEAF